MRRSCGICEDRSHHSPPLLPPPHPQSSTHDPLPFSPTNPPTNTDKYFHEERPAPGILILLLDRPRKKNAITGAMYLDLAEAMDRAAVDETVTCLVLTGKGDYFSSGADLTDDSWSPDPDHKMESSPAAIFMKVSVLAPLD